MSDQPLLDSVSIVLVKTSHPGNVGAAARAMKTMGLTDLRLVAPLDRDIARQETAVALASGAVDVLSGVCVYESLPEALSDCSLSFALSARLRDMGPTLQNPKEAAREATERLMRSESRCAFVFGAERTGLTNEELLVCNRQIVIEGNPEYCSLNLAQAVQIVSYVLRIQVLELSKAGTGQIAQAKPPRFSEKSAPSQVVKADALSVSRLSDHWLDAMTKVGFVNPDQPGKISPRLARLLARAELEKEEVDFLRGFLSDVVRVAEGRLYPHERASVGSKVEPNKPSE